MQNKMKYTYPDIQMAFDFPDPIPYECIGVYAIKNTKNGKMYIGSTKNMRSRTLMHISSIKRYHGVNKKMCEDIRRKTDFKYLKFIVLSFFADGTITDEILEKEEELFIKSYNTRENGYNKQYAIRANREKNGKKLYTKVVQENAWRCPLDPPPEEKPKPTMERITVLLPKGRKQEIEKFLPKNETLSGFINRLLLEYLDAPAAADQTQPEATQSHTGPPEDAQTVTQSAEDPQELPPLDWSQLPDDLNDMTPEQLDTLAKRHKARQAQEAPPETIPPEEWPFH